MSILGQTAAAVPVDYVIFGVVVALGFVAALALRVHRPRAVVGPERLATDQSAVQLAAAVCMGLGSWLVPQILYFSFAGIHQTPGVKPNIPPSGTAFLNTVPAIAFFITLWLVDWATGGLDLLNRLGIALRRFPAGVAIGILAALIIVPSTYVVLGIAQHVYDKVHFQHPTEHELLKVMRQPESRFVQVVLILAATVVAPIAEEFVFRGHIQTILRRAITVLASRRSSVTAPVPVASLLPPSQASTISIPVAYAAVSVPARPPAWQVWLSIIITSVLFTSVHEAWSWPAIFFLSLGLGYCYERTGNLWTSMTIHCLFNSASTFVFLNFKQS